MTEKILIVDDDPNVLKAYERRLRRRFQVETALCSEEGVTAVNFLGPFAVVVSDMMMPRENGAEFLARILQTAPESVRIMLTGNADQKTAAAAINQGQVFRFLNKPCEAETLEAAIEEGIAEYRRAQAERELLSKTVVGAVDLLTKVLALTSPEAFGRGSRLKSIVTEIAQAAGWEDAWMHEAVALLSQVGYVTVPEPVLAKVRAGEELSASERKAFASHTKVAEELISAIPRLETVARVVASQDLTILPDDADIETDGPRSSLRFGVQLLQLVRDYDQLLHDAGLSRPQAIKQLQQTQSHYDPECLEALQKSAAVHEQRVLVEVELDKLVDGMHLVADVVSTEGALLVAKGQDVNPTLRHRLANYAATHKVQQPIEVLASADMVQEHNLELASVAT